MDVRTLLTFSFCFFPIASSSRFQVELEDIEASEEEYPETRAFLLFLKTLVQNSPVPDTLGAGYRSCGFAPYLQFIRDSVFLNFDMRSYRRSGEKVSWPLVFSYPYVCIAM